MHSRCIRLLLLLCVLAAVPVNARDPGLAYGEDFVRESADWPESRPFTAALSTLSAPGAGAAGALDTLNQRLQALEAAGGPYAAGLDEPLTELGHRFAAAERWGEAVAAYQRSLHVIRINDGLYGVAQRPVVGALLALYRAAGDFETLDEQYDYFFRLYGNGQPPLDGVRWTATLAYLRWQREALRRDFDGNSARRLLELYELNEDLLERLALTESDWVNRRKLTLSQLRNLYLIDDSVAPPLDAYRGMRAVDPFARRDLVDVDVEQDRLQTLRRGSLTKGRDLLESLLAEAPDSVEEAAVVRALGDWYQWHDMSERALEYYREAIVLLRSAQRDDLVLEYWGEPTELPDNGSFWQPPDDDPEQETATVEATFNVSARGRPQQIEVETVAGRESASISVSREFRRLRFRPGFVNGEPVAVSKLRRRYTVYD